MKVTATALFVILISSCSMVIDSCLYDKICGQPLVNLEIDEDFDALSDIGWFLHENIEYKADGSDFTQSPARTWALKTGDCEDFAVLFLCIAYYELGLEGQLVAVDTDDIRTVEDGGRINHAMVRYNGVIYEPQNGCVCSGDVGYYYGFWAVFD